MGPYCDSVLIVGFGAPSSSEEVRPFLDNLFRAAPIPRERYQEVLRHYELAGGASPFNELTARQAQALGHLLEQRKVKLQIAVGMRNWKPYIADALAGLARRGSRRVLAFIMSPFRSEPSFGRYQQSIAEAQEKLALAAPAIEYPPPWHNHPMFLEAVAERVQKAIAELAPAQPGTAELVFTAHSIPVAAARPSRYAEQIGESARLVTELLAIKNFKLAFQSRSGSPAEPWLGPDVKEVLQSCKGPAVVIPIGFLCDNIEVLYDLDIEAASAARAAGVPMVRAGCFNDHPRFIEMIASIVQDRTGIGA